MAALSVVRLFVNRRYLTFVIIALDCEFHCPYPILPPLTGEGWDRGNARNAKNAIA
jgi:hypothetical protein